MTPEMENLKGYYKRFEKIEKQQLEELRETGNKRWIMFMRFSGECPDRHTTQDYYQCMCNGLLGEKDVIRKKGLTICLPANCPKLKED